jgi:hypothetical protein
MISENLTPRGRLTPAYTASTVAVAASTVELTLLTSTRT